MRFSAAILVVAAGFAHAQPAPGGIPAPSDRTVSISRQIVVYHPEGVLRSRVARKAEDIKENWLRVLGLEDDWEAPIVVQISTLRPPNSPRLRTGVYLSEGNQIKVQVDVYDPAVLRAPEFDLEMYRALTLEYAYRGNPPKAGKVVPQPPAWFLEAMLEEALARSDGVPAGIFQSIIDKGTPLKLDTFLKERPEMLDATSRAIYRAEAVTLLQALVAAPDGRQSLAAYLRTIPTVNLRDARQLMEKFPTFDGQPANLSKMWTLAMARASAADRVKPLGMAESLRQLAAILDLTGPTNPKRPEEAPLRGPAALPALARADAGRYVVRQKAWDLFRLEMHAHPFVRPLVEEYRLIASELADRPRKNFDRRLKKNIELEKAVAGSAGEIEDYMNWFEAANLHTSSEEFDSLPVDDMDARRGDPISRELDLMEARGW